MCVAALCLSRVTVFVGICMRKVCILPSSASNLVCSGGGREEGSALHRDRIWNQTIPRRAHLQVQLETRLRSEKEKMDDVSKVCEGKDEQIAHLRRFFAHIYFAATTAMLIMRT